MPPINFPAGGTFPPVFLLAGFTGYFFESRRNQLQSGLSDVNPVTKGDLPFTVPAEPVYEGPKRAPKVLHPVITVLRPHYAVPTGYRSVRAQA